MDVVFSVVSPEKKQEHQCLRTEGQYLCCRGEKSIACHLPFNSVQTYGGLDDAST